MDSVMMVPASWIIIGIILAGLEVLIPGVFLLWFGISAIIVGVLNTIIPLDFMYALLLFTLISLVSILIVIKFFRKKDQTTRSSKTENVNATFGSNFIGQIITVTTDLDDEGQIKMGDSVWFVKGPRCKKGSKIRLISFQNNVFNYELVEE